MPLYILLNILNAEALGISVMEKISFITVYTKMDFIQINLLLLLCEK